MRQEEKAPNIRPPNDDIFAGPNDSIVTVLGSRENVEQCIMFLDDNVGSFQTEEIRFEEDNRGDIYGAKGSNITAAITASGVLSVDVDRKNCVVTIIGQPHQIDEARLPFFLRTKCHPHVNPPWAGTGPHFVPGLPHVVAHSATLLDQARAYFEVQNAELELTVPLAKALLGSIPGIIKLKRMTNVSEVNVTYHHDYAIVTVGGFGNSVTKAEDYLAECKASMAARSISVPEAAIPFVIGKKGDSIKKVGVASGAEIHIEDRAERSRDSSGPQMREIMLCGTEDQVFNAQQLLEAQVDFYFKDGPKARPKPSGPNEDIPLEESQRGFVIGRGGATIKRLQEESGARLDIDRDTGVLNISGSEEQIKKAKELVEALLIDQESGGGRGGGGGGDRL